MDPLTGETAHLREFLYVDVDKTRALLAQLDEGIIEQVQVRDARRKVFGGGVKAFVEASEESVSEEATQKSMADAFFPVLESALESLGELRDISEEARDENNWSDDNLMRKAYPPGTIIRVTASGFFFDSRFFADSIANVVAVGVGLENTLNARPEQPAAPVPPRAKQPRPAGAGSGSRIAVAKEWPDLPLEAQIPLDARPLGLSGEQMRGLIQVARGLYSPGLNLQLFPVANNDAMISCRLQEGRRYLDSERDVLFARYGVTLQEWTVVGYVGQFADSLGEFPEYNFMSGAGIVRSRFTKFIHLFLQFLGTSGFADLAQQPSFSVVPLAVYRYLNPSKHDPA